MGRAGNGFSRNPGNRPTVVDAWVDSLSPVGSAKELTGCLKGTSKYLVVFDWDPEKNETLKRERGEITFLLGDGRLWKIESHYNQENYPNQQIFFIPTGDYVYLVPFVQDGETLFLKTAFPSRKATKEFRKETA